MSRPKGNGHTRKRASSVRLLLLTGIPAMGKSHIGCYLSEHHGFKHLDIEKDNRFLSGGESVIRQGVARLREQGRNVVISWGFVPDDLDVVLLLRGLGFRWIWFDGDRDKAHAEFLALGRPEADWCVQLRKIERVIDAKMQALTPEVIDTFSQEGNRRDEAEIADQLLRPLTT